MERATVAPVAEDGVHLRAVGVEHVHGHEGEDGAGKAAAMDAPRAASGEHAPAHLQRQRHFLIAAAGHVEVLQKFPAALAGGDQRAQERAHVVAFQRRHGLAHARGLVEEVEGAEDGAVGHAVFELGQGGVERFDVRFRQHAHAQRLRRPRAARW